MVNLANDLFKNCPIGPVTRKVRYHGYIAYAQRGLWVIGSISGTTCPNFAKFSVHIAGYTCLLENSRKSWIVFVKFPGAGKSRKMSLVLESPGIARQ